MISKDRDNVSGRYLYRLSHPLGEHVLDAGRTLQTPEAKVVFKISDHPTKISAVEKLKGLWGWLSLHHLSIDSFEREEYLVFTAMDRKQRPLDQETCEKLFMVEGIAWRAYDEAAKAIEGQKDELLDGLKAQLKMKVAETLLFSIQWEVR